MPEIRESEFHKLAARNFPESAAILLYGTDAEAVAHCARLVEAAWKGGEVKTLSATGLAGSIGELEDGLRAQSLFGGRGLVVLRGCGEQHAGALVPLLSEAGWPNLLLVVADSLRKNSALRSVASKSAAVLAVGLHAEDEAAFLRRIEDMAREKSLQLGDGAAATLQALCGSDRELISMELEKLCLLRSGREVVTVSMVEESCGDQAAANTEALIDSVLGGDVQSADRLLQRAIANGDLNGVLAIMLSRLSRLSTVRAAVDSGLSWEGAFMRARPPIFFGQQQVVRDQVSRLSQDLLLRLQEQVQDAIYQGRRLGAAGDMAVGRSLLAMAVRMSPGAR